MRWFTDPDAYTRFCISIGHSATDVLLSSVSCNASNYLLSSRCLFFFIPSRSPASLRGLINSNAIFLSRYRELLLNPSLRCRISNPSTVTLSMAVHNPRAYPTYIIVRLDCRIRPLIPSVFIYAIVFSSMYPSLPSSAALNLNFALLPKPLHPCSSLKWPYPKMRS